MVSNSPPEQLKVFLTSLVLKVNARGIQQGKKKLITGCESSHFEEISPLTIRDLQLSRKNCKNLPNKENGETPKRRDANTMKRKLSDVDNCQNDESTPPAKKPLILNRCTMSLCEEQLKVIDMVKTGNNVFFTGSAGTGKTYLLQKIIKTLPPETTYITASTGAAACMIGGTTLHSFAGTGMGEGSFEQCLSLASREHKAANWRRCKCLIIDEISMVDGEYFDKLEAIARALRKSKHPFGGIQLVLCGDFLQLPPVSKHTKKLYCFQVRHS